VAFSFAKFLAAAQSGGVDRPVYGRGGGLAGRGIAMMLGL
jgi:hypothetical protein